MMTRSPIYIFVILVLVSPAMVRSDASNSAAFAAHADGNFSQVDLSDGSYTVLGQVTTRGGVSGIATDGETLYATLGGGPAELVTLDPATGNILTTVGTVTLDGGGGCSIGDIAMGANNILYGITANSRGHVCEGPDENNVSAGTILVIDTSTAVATALGRPVEDQFGDGNVNGGLAVDGEGNLWLSPGWNHPDPGHFYVINTSTGLIESTLDLSGDLASRPDGPNGLMWNPEDGLLYASFIQFDLDTGLWSVDPATGESTLITDSAARFHDLVSPQAISSSEPSSSAPVNVPALPFAGLFLLLGAVAVTGLRKLSRRQS